MNEMQQGELSPFLHTESPLVETLVPMIVLSSFPMRGDDHGYLLLEECARPQLYLARQSDFNEAQITGHDNYFNIPRRSREDVTSITHPSVFPLGKKTEDDSGKVIRRTYLTRLFGHVLSAKFPVDHRLFPSQEEVFSDEILMMCEDFYEHHFEASLREEMKTNAFQFERKSAACYIGNTRYYVPRTLYYYPEFNLVTSRWILGSRARMNTAHPDPLNEHFISTPANVLQIHHHFRNTRWEELGAIYMKDPKIKALIDLFIASGYMSESVIQVFSAKK